MDVNVFKNIIFLGIDFKELCGILNFVVMSYRYFNEDCIPALKYTGLAPISGNFTYTMVF